MRRLSFSPQELQQISYERYHADLPKIRQRMDILWLFHHRILVKDIAEIAGCCENTVRNTLDLFLEGGLPSVRTFQIPQQQRESSLAPFRQQILEDFEKNPPHTVLEATERIAHLTGLRLSTEAIRQFLHQLGLKHLKTGSLPGKADPVAQAEFQKKSLNHAWKKPG